jgi:hypothetical protein
MATRVDIVLHEDNDEVLSLVVTPVDANEDLTDITTLELYLKPQNCTSDEDPLVLVLTSADVLQINITTQSAVLITADAFIPASALASPYDRFWRLDTLNAAGDRRTAMYGEVTVVNL